MSKRLKKGGKPTKRKVRTEVIPWEALVDFRQAREIMLAFSEREDVRNSFEWFVSEFHNNPTLREFQDYMKSEGEGRVGVEEPAVQELMIRPFVDQFEVIWKFWGQIRDRLIREIGTQKAVIVDDL